MKIKHSLYTPLHAGIAICIFFTPFLMSWLPPLSLYDEQPESQTNLVALNTTEQFGKTHFIVGYQEEVPVQEPVATVEPDTVDVVPQTGDGRVCHALFAPDDNVRETLLALIAREQQSILMTAYLLTDKKIARALRKAHKRGVRVEIIVDPNCLRDAYNKVGPLYEKGLSVYVYKPAARRGIINSLMHDKFVLFQKNIYNGANIVWTGSVNFTRSGPDINQENVVISNDTQLYTKFKKQFETLKGRSERYEDTAVSNVALHERMRNTKSNKSKAKTTRKNN